VRGYRLRFNLEGRPRGKAAPANVFPDPQAEVWYSATIWMRTWRQSG
jgi:hypothetical protein